MPVKDDPAVQVLNAKILTGAVMRTRRPGDRIRPLGGGDKLLSDYFIDKKIDRPLRDAIPLVAVGSRVHWVRGHNISAEAAVRPGDAAVKQVWRMSGDGMTDSLSQPAAASSLEAGAKRPADRSLPL